MKEFDFVPADLDGCPCYGSGWLGKEWLYCRESQCDCGAGCPDDPVLLHAVSCDCVPCPFCPLEVMNELP